MTRGFTQGVRYLKGFAHLSKLDSIPGSGLTGDDYEQLFQWIGPILQDGHGIMSSGSTKVRMAVPTRLQFLAGSLLT